jgi:hypothetical protein
MQSDESVTLRVSAGLDQTKMAPNGRAVARLP